MKKLLAICFCVLLAVFLSVCAFAESVDSLTVISATSDSSTKLSDLEVKEEGLFCGWFTSLTAATNLDVSKAAKDGHIGTVYGTVIPFTADELSLTGVQMRTSSPYGLRFIAEIDKLLMNAIQKLNAKNRCGVNGTLTPKTEYYTGIGYGITLALDTSATPLTKMNGTTVANGVTVAGVHTFSESSTGITYTATVLGIDNASAGTEIAARPYLTYADVNGIERTVYYSENGSINGAYSVSIYEVAELIVNDSSATAAQKSAANSIISNGTAPVAVLTTIDNLNLSAVENSADNDNAYVEFDMSSLVTLDESDHSYYQYAFYPRVTKVRDDLYLMTFMRYQTGDHIYYATSKDGKNWDTPSYLYKCFDEKIVLEGGVLDGTIDDMIAANADHCLLDDGTILCVFSVRPCIGYSKPDYSYLSGLLLVRGEVDSNGNIIWDEPTRIYSGQNWEPDIIQRQNGKIEIYFTHIAPMIHKYGYYSAFRSSGVGMLSSSDGGKTWTPNVTQNSTSTNFAAKRILQYSAGNFTVNSGASVPFFCGQMPGVVELTNGKIMVAVEAKKIGESNFKISVAWSGSNGAWTELAMDEAGPSTLKGDLFTGAGPTLSRFPSGEVLMSYNSSSLMQLKVLNKTGSNATSVPTLAPFQNQAAGFWSFTSVVDSHTAMAGMAFKRYAGVVPETDANGEEILHNTFVLGKFRLNHTIDATKKAVNLDGNLKEWKYIDDALFVGSQKGTLQAAYRFAYDENYIYIAIDRKDNANDGGDKNYVYIATPDGYIDVTVSYGTNSLPSGVSVSNKSVSGGRTYEIRLDRNALGLDGEFIRVCPGFTDVSTGIDDRINGTLLTDTSTWLKINLK